MIQKLLAVGLVLSFIGTTKALADDKSGPGGSVAVVPFDVIGTDGHAWLGRAIQEGLATGIQKLTGVHGIIVSGIAPGDAPSALALAQSTGADTVVFGDVQVLDDQIRVTGQLISSHSGSSIGALDFDGNVRDLFKIEDVLTEQCRHAVVPPAPRTAAPTAQPVGFEIVGPTLTPVSSRYFDSNLASQIKPAGMNLQDDYDRYYYYQSDATCLSGCGIGAPICGGIGYGGGFCGAGCSPCPVAPRGAGHMVSPVASAMSGW